MGSFASIAPRYRRWLTPSASLDGSVGLRWTEGRVETVDARLDLTHRDLVGVWAEAVLDLGEDRIGYGSGVKVDSQLGIASYALGAITLGVVLVVFLTTYES
jgi:hypothetical protein